MMIDTPKVVDATAKNAAVIPLLLTRDQMQREIGMAIHEIFAVLREEGLVPAGPVFTSHRARPTTHFDFDVGVALDVPLHHSSGRVKAGTQPGGRVLRTIFTGAYDRLGEGWSEFRDWAAANHYQMTERFWECYLRGAETGQPSSEWQTELNWLIRV